MPLETLEEIRLLSNLETDQHKLLQMVLFGQPELDEKLAQPQIRQLRERITHSFYLDPFPPDDTLEYLNFRMRAVGYRGPDLFNRKIAKTVERYSGGLTRRINIIADKALMAAYSEAGHAVCTKHVKAAAEDSNFARRAGYRPWLAGSFAAASLVVALWLGTMLPGWLDTTEGPGPGASAVPASAPAAQPAATAAASPDRRTPAVAVVAAAAPSQQPAISGADAVQYSLLDLRLGHTSDWLRQAPDNHYSIQISVTRATETDALEEFLQNPPGLLDPEKIYVYETMIGGNRMYSVLYGDYATRTNARSMLTSLPEDLQANRPYVRRISALRRDPQAES